MCELDTVRFIFTRHLERFTGATWATWATDDDGAYMRFTARGVSLALPGDTDLGEDLARQCAKNWANLRAIYKQRPLRATFRAG